MICERRSRATRFGLLVAQQRSHCIGRCSAPRLAASQGRTPGARRRRRGGAGGQLCNIGRRAAVGHSAQARLMEKCKAPPLLKTVALAEHSLGTARGIASWTGRGPGPWRHERKARNGHAGTSACRDAGHMRGRRHGGGYCGMNAGHGSGTRHHVGHGGTNVGHGAGHARGL